MQKQREWVFGTISGVVMIQLLLLLWLKSVIWLPNCFLCSSITASYSFSFLPFVMVDFNENYYLMVFLIDFLFIYFSTPSTFLYWFYSQFFTSDIGLQDGAAVTGLAIAATSLVAVQMTGNAMYDPIGSIIVGNLLGLVCYSLYVCASYILHVAYSSVL